MSALVPDTTPGAWDVIFNLGADWPATTISFTRDGVAVIPTSAALTIHSPDGTLLLTVNASISGGGVMTVGPVLAATTAAFTWQYGNLVFTTSESGVITDLLAGNATVRNFSDQMADINVSLSGGSITVVDLNRGYSGYSGSSGKSGYSGANPGASGYSGYSGKSGYSGISGKSGYSGASGYSGYSGRSAYSGYSGISGFSGYSGTSGFSGYSGISGFSGYSGKSGYSGISGFSGYSATTAGFTGTFTTQALTVATVVDGLITGIA